MSEIERRQLAYDIPTWVDLPFGGGNEYVKLDANAAYAVAGVLIEKGWTKPRIITTGGELDALGAGSVIHGISGSHFGLSEYVDSFKPHPHVKEGDGSWWSTIDGDCFKSEEFFWKDSPTVTVLHEEAA